MIKSTFHGNIPSTVQHYPYIGKSRIIDLIVLFTGPKTGLVVLTSPGSNWSIGHYSKEWDETNFAQINGAVTLIQE